MAGEAGRVEGVAPERLRRAAQLLRDLKMPANYMIQYPQLLEKLAALTGAREESGREQG